MAFIVGLLLAALSALVVLWPLLRRHTPRRNPPLEEDLAAWEARWKTLLDEMVSLQTDADLGRIPMAEFQERLDSLRLEAAQVLKALREHQGQPVPPPSPAPTSLSSQRGEGM